METNGNGKTNLVKPHILLIGLVLVVFNSYWCLMGTEVWHSTQLTIASLFFNAVFTLLVFVLVNLLLQRFMPRLAMSEADPRCGTLRS
jgi:Na+/phosphate symporter